MNYKLYIFKNNTPWGLQKKYDGSNVYKNVVNFVNANGDYDWNAKREFLSKMIGGNFETVIQTSKEHNIELVNELTVNAFVSLATQPHFNSIEDLMMSDYGILTTPSGIHKYYSVAVLRQDRGQVKISMSLDIFMNYNLDNNFFIDKAQAFMKKGHINRYLPNGDINEEALLRNKINLIPMKSLPRKEIEWNDFSAHNHPTDENGRKLKKILKKMKWVMIYVLKANVYKVLKEFGLPPVFTEKEVKDFIKDNNFLVNGLYMNYHIILLPIVSNQIVLINNNYIASQLFINNILTKLKDEILTIQIFPKLLTDYRFGYLYTGGEFFISLTKANEKGVVLFKNMVPFIRWVQFGSNVGQINMVNEIVLIENPILLHPKINKIFIKTWNGAELSYPFIFTKKYSYNMWLRGVLFYSPTETDNMFWLEEKEEINANPLLTGKYLSVENNNTLILSQSKYDEYMRDNANTFNQKKYYDRLQGQVAIANAATNTLMKMIGGGMAGFKSSGPVGAGLGILGGTISGGMDIANNVIAYDRMNAMREAQIDDLENQLPSVKLGNTTNANSIMSIMFQYDDIEVYQKVLLEHDKNNLIDLDNTYGWDVNLNKETKNIMNTRKQFNYLQIDNIFSTIKHKLSALIKQQIGEAFSNGMTIWHYRVDNNNKLIDNVIQDFKQDNSEVA